MKNNLFKKLFDFDINAVHKISVSKNEIYNQLLLYIFFTTKKNLLLVVSTLNEATEIFLEQMKAINVPMEEVKEIISKKYI